MKQAVQWVLIALAGVVLVLSTVFVGSRLLGRDSPDLRLMQQASPTPGRNAFPALWLMDYRVPVDDLERVAAEDVERFVRWQPPAAVPNQQGGLSVPAFTSVAAGRYPRIQRSQGNGPDWCRLHSEDCLVHVRAHRDGLASRLAAERELLDKTRGLSSYGHYRTGFAARADRPWWGELDQGPAVLLTRQALDFVDGDATPAMVDVCRTVSTWRPLVANSDSLVLAMTGIRVVEASSSLLAAMLAELPPGTAVPAACTAAYAPPVPEEFLPCAAMRGEFAFVTAVGEQAVASEGAGSRLLYDPAMTRVRTAANLSLACTSEGRDAAMRGERLATPRLGHWLARGCAGNLVGCMLSEIAAPAYDHYLHRYQDHAARLQLMATLLWLQAGDPTQRVARPVRGAACGASPTGSRDRFGADARGSGVAAGTVQPAAGDPLAGSAAGVCAPLTGSGVPAPGAPASESRCRRLSRT